MRKTTRRHLLQAAAAGGVSAVGLSAIVGAAQQPGSGSLHAHDNRPLTDKRAHTVVSFGQWDADRANPLDRQPINAEVETRTRNIHLMLPFEAEVDAGGAVSFIISGLHQIVIYSERELADVQAGWAAAGNPVIPGLPPVIEYATDRVYRGMDPRVLQYLPVAGLPNPVVDRIEAVNFAAPGRYLVVCGVVPHFIEGMHGYVNVKA